MKGLEAEEMMAPFSLKEKSNPRLRSFNNVTEM